MKKRVLAILMTLVMVVTLMPATVFGAGNGDVFEDYHGYISWERLIDKNQELPESVTVYLQISTREGRHEVHYDYATAEDGWKWSFGNIYDYLKEGEQLFSVKFICYPAKGFINDKCTTENGNMVCYMKESIAVDVFWEDDNNRDNLRPQELQGEIMYRINDSNDIYVDEVELCGKNEGISHVRRYDQNGEERDYSFKITEESISRLEASGYSIDIIKNKGKVNIVFTKTPKTINLSGNISWFDGDNADKVRPESVNVKLMANGKKIDSAVVTEQDNWKWSFGDVYKYEKGKEIKYTYAVDRIDGYNSYIKDEQIKFSRVKDIVGSITWDDADNQDGIRPAGMTVEYVFDGESGAVGPIFFKAPEPGKTYEEFKVLENSPVYDEDGRKIEYDIIIHGYFNDEYRTHPMTTYTVEKNGLNLKLSHEVEKVDLSGTVKWIDDSNKNSKRPKSVKIHLLADDVEIATTDVTAEDNWEWSFENLDKFKDGYNIEYSYEIDNVDNYRKTVKGQNTTFIETQSITTNIIWDDADNQDGKRPEKIATALKNGNSSTEFKFNEPVDWLQSWTVDTFDKQGSKYEYTTEIHEDSKTALEQAGYTITIDGHNVKLFRAPEVIDIQGQIEWHDADNQDGKRPEVVNVELYANGKKADTVAVTAENGWKWAFEDVDKFDAGKEIEYTVQQTAVDGYTSSAEGNNFTYKHEPEKTILPVAVEWCDDENADGIRPESVNAVLVADGEETETSLQLTAENDWETEFTALDKYKAGKEIEYTYRVADVAGYEKVMVDEGAVFLQEKEYIANIIWDDADNQDGKRPESVTVNLVSENGTDEAALTGDGWNASWTKTAFDVDGKPLANELVIDEEDAAALESAGYIIAIDGFTVTLSHAVESIDVTGEIEWDDADNQDGQRPESVNVDLYADGEKADTVTVTAENGWKWAFEDVNKYEAGKEIEYEISISEEAVATLESAGYTITIDGTNVMLFREPDVVEPPVEPSEPTDSTEPVVPEDPTEPVVPEEPTEPVVPEEPTKPMDETSDGGTQTGDDFDIGLYAFIALLALATAGVTVRRRTIK